MPSRRRDQPLQGLLEEDGSSDFGTPVEALATSDASPVARLGCSSGTSSEGRRRCDSPRSRPPLATIGPRVRLTLCRRPRGRGGTPTPARGCPRRPIGGRPTSESGPIAQNRPVARTVHSGAGSVGLPRPRRSSGLGWPRRRRGDLATSQGRMPRVTPRSPPPGLSSCSRPWRWPRAPAAPPIDVDVDPVAPTDVAETAEPLETPHRRPTTVSTEPPVEPARPTPSGAGSGTRSPPASRCTRLRRADEAAAGPASAHLRRCHKSTPPTSRPGSRTSSRRPPTARRPSQARSRTGATSSTRSAGRRLPDRGHDRPARWHDIGDDPVRRRLPAPIERSRRSPTRHARPAPATSSAPRSSRSS